MEQDVQKLQDKVLEVDSKVGNIEDGHFTKEMIQTVKEITLEQSQKQENQGTDNTEEVMKATEDKNKAQMEEIEDRMRRKTNLVLFRVPEDNTQPIQERQKKDNTTVQQLLEEIQTEHKPIDVRRLGNIKKEQGDNPKPRTLRMTFPTEAARDDVLTAFHKAKKQKVEDENRICTKISIRKDLTPLERREEEELFQELKAKREKSEQSGDEYAHWVRMRGRVVNIGKYPVNQEEKKDNGVSKTPGPVCTSVRIVD